MKVIFVGLMFSERSLLDAHKYSPIGVQMAPQNFQKNLIHGMEACEDVTVDLVNVIPVGSYPKNYKKLFIKGGKWGKDNFEPTFINLPWIKRKMQKKTITKFIEDKVEKYGVEDTVVVFYHIFKPFLEVAEKIKKKHPNLRTCAIMTDPLPGCSDISKRVSDEAERKGKKLVEMSKKIDGFILLTDYMAEALDVGVRPYTVIECICDVNQPPNSFNSQTGNACLYTGTVEAEYGIRELANAFVGLNNASLTICGGGDSATYLREMSRRYDNINYLGFVNSSEVARLRNECDFLINPRRPTGTYTKYSFPSKTAEYMASGKPVIMYKLEGIPDEYDNFLVYLKGNSVEQIREELNEIFAGDYSHYQKIGESAREFVIRNKSTIAQGKRVVDFLKGI